jgi:hypothetical protein
MMYPVAVFGVFGVISPVPQYRDEIRDMIPIHHQKCLCLFAAMGMLSPTYFFPALPATSRKSAGQILSLVIIARLMGTFQVTPLVTNDFRGF